MKQNFNKLIKIDYKIVTATSLSIVKQSTTPVILICRASGSEIILCSSKLKL